MNVLLWAVIGYAAGALPSAWIVAGFTGHRDLLRDVRRDHGETDAHVQLKEHGAGRAATVAAALDVLKGFVPVLLASGSGGPYAAAACGVGAVTGHCWPPVYRRFAGRGLSAAAGAFLALLPLEMTAGGIVTALGIFAKVGGAASTAGFVSIPVVAWLRGQPQPYLVMAGAIQLLIFARRLEGVGADIAGGVPAWRAVLRRALLDVSRAK